MTSQRRTTVTLSGVVGAGKSSTAKAIVQALRSAGCAAEYVRFQELTGARGHGGRTGGAAARGEASEPSPGGTRWRGYTRRRLSAGVALGYALRTLVFRARLRRWPKDTVLVFDRYFYDSLAHFELQVAGRPLTMLMKAIPTPTVAALLLIRESTLMERRGRYSPEYAHQVSDAYAALPVCFPGLLVARTDDLASVDEVAGRIVAEVLTKIGPADARVSA